MRYIILRIILICVGLGVGIGILSLYNFDLTALLSSIIDGFAWIINGIADAISGNDAARQVLTSRPH